MKSTKAVAVLFSATLSIGMLAACSSEDEKEKSEPTSSASPSSSKKDDKEATPEETVKPSEGSLASLDPNAFNDVLAVSAKIDASQDDAAVQEDARTVRVNEEGKVDPQGRFSVVESTLVPVLCYSDSKNKVSFKVTTEDKILIDLAPVENCDYEFDSSLQLRIESADGITAEAVLPEKFPAELEPLFMAFANGISKLGS